MQRSFIDLLFILLCAALVMLARSSRLDLLEAQPIGTGDHALSTLDPTQVELVAVTSDGLRWVRPDGPVRLTDASELMAQLPDRVSVALVPGEPDVAHARVLRVWDRLQRMGCSVALAVEPEGGTP